MKKTKRPSLTRREAQTLYDVGMLFRSKLHPSQRTGRGDKLFAKLMAMGAKP